MLEFLGSIGDAISAVLNFISTMVTGIAQVFVLVGQSFGYLTVLFNLLPPVLYVFAVAGITVAIFYHLIGR